MLTITKERAAEFDEQYRLRLRYGLGIELPPHISASEHAEELGLLRIKG